MFFLLRLYQVQLSNCFLPQLRDRLARRREDRARRKAQEELERAAKENKKTTDNLEQEENHSPETASTNQVAKRLEKLNGDYKSSLPVCVSVVNLACMCLCNSISQCNHTDVETR